jgi:hypothetical protein
VRGTDVSLAEGWSLLDLRRGAGISCEHLHGASPSLILIALIVGTTALILLSFGIPGMSLLALIATLVLLGGVLLLRYGRWN